jgi:hypothetical protein
MITFVQKSEEILIFELPEKYKFIYLFTATPSRAEKPYSGR